MPSILVRIDSYFPYFVIAEALALFKNCFVWLKHSVCTISETWNGHIVQIEGSNVIFKQNVFHSLAALCDISSGYSRFA